MSADDHYRHMRAEDVHRAGKAGGWHPADPHDVKWLKSSPPAFGQDRPIKNMGVHENGKGHTPPTNIEGSSS